mmetsp:Transcript_8267/g.20623  ORF Transcript_8267/g.20623 Transcript_8267/m.20623 type:complete len:372 (+) Transcript_8267:1282-2397(+)
MTSNSTTDSSAKRNRHPSIITTTLLPSDHGVVRQVDSQPLLNLRHIHALPCSIVLHLVLLDLPYRKVLAHAVRENQPRHARTRRHHVALREAHVEPVGLHQLPHQRLFGVVRLAGVTRRGADALVLDLEEVGLVEGFLVGVAPDGAADFLVEFLREGLCETIRNCVDHDHAIVIELGLVFLAEDRGADAASGRKHADVVLLATGFGSDEVGESHERVCLLIGADLLKLLTDSVEGADLGGVAAVVVVRIDLDVVTHRVGRADCHDSVGSNRLGLRKVVKHLIGLIKEPPRLLADRRVLKQLGVSTVRILTADLPNMEERVPVDVRPQLLDVVVHKLGDPQALGGRRRRGLLPVNHERTLAGGFQIDVLLVF